jgi:hypothetical protein
MSLAEMADIVRLVDEYETNQRMISSPSYWHAYDLRPGGSHGNPHPTARIHIHTGRRSSCVAARGALAAAGYAGDRVD